MSPYDDRPVADDPDLPHADSRGLKRGIGFGLGFTFIVLVVALVLLLLLR